ncbi:MULTISPECIES: hypothetical protein [unclassified Streptomyces]|uniref:hypothetical protein n=1 Tax=unclassified Streptomyces TaxID=2593676 RepID=UPI0007ECF698|nr:MULTISPECIES: hypothetical protein [unclassified Streptomyces]MCP3771451.1 hypothetical protein [Streptomyces sp. MAR25Y5]OBQ53862.1 hypothetical protein A4U61_06990 [Streptomyces sp. H-KF8]
MQDPSDSTERAGPEENGRSNTADSPVVDDPTSDSDIDSTTASTVLVEVLPGVALVAGEVPPELKPDLIDFGIVPAADRKQISAILASIGNAATVAGNLGNAFAGVQGLYRISDATQALLRSGVTLAVKDGANLGTVMVPGRFIAQARFIPVTAVSKAQTAASIGPALAMVALQMTLSEVTGLVRTNLALTSQVLTAIRKDQWAELTGLVAAIDRAVDQAREIESVPTSLWEDVAGSGALLQKQLELYQGNVRDHVGQIGRPDARSYREYLQTNAEAIVFDAYALLSSVKAWTGYHALRAARARAAGREDAAEAQYAEVIARDTRAEFDSALAETTSLVDALTRELRIIAELPGPDAWPLPGKRKDVKAAREASARLLKAIEPLADALHPPAPPLEAPGVVCVPESLELEPYLRILRWLLEDGETLRVLGFPDQLDALGPISAIVGGAKEKLAAARDKAAAKTLVAVTDRRIVTAKTNAFLEQAEIRQDIPIDQVRYVRAATAQDRGGRLAVDLITRDENIRWLFPADMGNAQVDGLAAVLAESMTIPDGERDALQRRRHAPIEAGSEGESTGTRSTEPTGSESATCDAE